MVTVMGEPFQQAFPGEPAAVEAACTWMGAILRSLQFDQVDLALRVTRELMTAAVRHTPLSERVHLRVIASETSVVIEACDPDVPVGGGRADGSWAVVSRAVVEFGARKIAGQGHVAWVLLPLRRAPHDRS